jgi:hypothetical protein
MKEKDVGNGDSLCGPYLIEKIKTNGSPLFGRRSFFQPYYSLFFAKNPSSK